jgi:hypothetical protein
MPLESFDSALQCILRSLAFNGSVLYEGVTRNTPLHFATYGSPVKILHLLVSTVEAFSVRTSLTQPRLVDLPALGKESMPNFTQARAQTSQ